MSTLRSLARRCGTLAITVLLSAAHARAGGSLDTLDLDQGEPIAGLDAPATAVRVVPMRLDARCIPVQYTLNATRDPIPSPPGTPALTLDDAQSGLQASMDAWGAIPTSFVEMRITGRTQNPGTTGFDFVNEASFAFDPDFGAGVLGISLSTALMAEQRLAEGDDLDRDGDADVQAASAATCSDADGDGDLEFPAGLYPAGTIMDNDVQFNAAGARFTVRDDQIDADPRSVDLSAIAIHEFGHSQGLAHSPLSERSAQDGGAATMFPSVDTADPAAERIQGTLDADAIATSSAMYPEGTASRGPAALTGSDVAFASRFGRISGSVRDRGGTPRIGAQVFCVDPLTRAVLGTALSGSVRIGLDPVAGTLVPLPPQQTTVDGSFAVTVPSGRYQCGIEGIDGTPVLPLQVNLTLTQAALFLPQPPLAQEFFQEGSESFAEAAPGAASAIEVTAGQTRPSLDFVANADRILSGARRAEGALGSPSLAMIGAPGAIMAVAIRGAALLQAEQDAIAALGPGTTLAIHTAAYHTDPRVPSLVARYASASIHRCSLGSDATTGAASLAVDMQTPLRSVRPFRGEENDFAPFFLSDAADLAARILAAARGSSLPDVCLLLEFMPDEADAAAVFADAPATPPALPQPLLGVSFASSDGGRSFAPLAVDLQFQLGVSALPTP
jgi:hypothetical protein